jgi:hypothetical protein
MSEHQRLKLIIVTGLGTLSLLIAAVFTIWHTHSLSATIVVDAVPRSSQITIEAHKGRQGVNKVKPGTYHITVSHKGFSSVTQTITIQKNHSKTVDFVLVSNSSSTSNWYYTHLDDAKAAEGISDRETDQLSTQSLSNAPLIQLLPFVAGGLEFRVDYGNEPGAKAGEPIIYITAPDEQSQQDGVAWIKSLGFNPSEYRIKFVTATVQPINQ